MQTLDELAEVIPARETVESEVDRHELTAALRLFLDTLPEQSRQIFMERYYFAQPVQKIAEMYRMRETAVSVLLHRIRKKLKKHLEQARSFAEKRSAEASAARAKANELEKTLTSQVRKKLQTLSKTTNLHL